MSAWYFQRAKALCACNSPECPQHGGNPSCQGWELGCDAPARTCSLGILCQACLHIQLQVFHGHLGSGTCCQ